MRAGLLGDFELLCIPCYGGMPTQMTEQSLRTFASQVLPELHR
jgi:hypothetical protein